MNEVYQRSCVFGIGVLRLDEKEKKKQNAIMSEDEKPTSPLTTKKFIDITLPSNQLSENNDLVKLPFDREEILKRQKEWFNGLRKKEGLTTIEGGIDWKKAIIPLLTEIEIRQQIAREVVSSDPQVKDQLEPLIPKALLRKWLGDLIEKPDQTDITPPPSKI